MGSAGKMLVDASIIVSQVGKACYVLANICMYTHFLSVSYILGFTCAYLIFISENLHSIYSALPK